MTGELKRLRRKKKGQGKRIRRGEQGKKGEN